MLAYIFLCVKKSPDWLQRKAQAKTGMWQAIRGNLPLMIYAILIMTAINFYAHGTQDLYPSAFLRVQHGFSVSTVSKIAIVYSIGAILGCVLVASLSQKIGRRRAIVGSALLSILVIPLWAFSNDPIYLGVGAFLMQFLVQGCFGVVPAHLNELSPAEVRGTFPGFVYQFGNFLAAGNATIQSLIADHMDHNYSFALAVVPFFGAIVIAGLVGIGREGRDVKMGGEAPSEQ